MTKVIGYKVGWINAAATPSLIGAVISDALRSLSTKDSQALFKGVTIDKELEGATYLQFEFWSEKDG